MLIKESGRLGTPRAGNLVRFACIMNCWTLACSGILDAFD
jgi:hypothetical protein